MSLLSIIGAAADRVGVVRPTSVLGSTDAQVRQLAALASQDGRELAKRHMWEKLTKEKTWTAVATETQTGILPVDFDRFVPGTFYNRGRTRLVTGPLTAQEYQDYKSRLASIVYDAFRVRGGAILLLPTPNGADTYAFEYISTYWCGAGSATEPTQADWASDSDIAFVPEELITLGVVWRFKKSKGLDYAEDFRSYEVQVSQYATHDGGKRTLMMSGNQRRFSPRAPQAPDGSWQLT